MIIPKKNMGERTRHHWTINDVAELLIRMKLIAGLLISVAGY